MYRIHHISLIPVKRFAILKTKTDTSFPSIASLSVSESPWDCAIGQPISAKRQEAAPKRSNGARTSCPHV